MPLKPNFIAKNTGMCRHTIIIYGEATLVQYDVNFIDQMTMLHYDLNFVARRSAHSNFRKMTLMAL